MEQQQEHEQETNRSRNRSHRNIHLSNKERTITYICAGTWTDGR